MLETGGAWLTWSWMLRNRSRVVLAENARQGSAEISRRCSFRALFAVASGLGRFRASTLRTQDGRGFEF
ncbi:hypothetical protein E2562_013518 [Oryza meyeriana var. granulata]|uniref:Uncharacterized protein n=1 Tax=Oryza meyeriana var. granulata TaxID=110450 RepID=A0A6G1BUY0_9ORYZ|nr:hypothetical protein E2562_013518 [Oryza meyeriana var. granulata]